MEYNTSRDLLIMPEYGRNVQKLVNHAKTIEDRDARQASAERIVNLMMQMHPQNKNVSDFREKLWKHLFRIANYELDVDSPSGKIPPLEDTRVKPDPVPYPETEVRYRHYGHNIQTLIKKALATEKGPKRDGLIGVIGAYMKLAYRTWNREHYISDDIIKGDLATLSNGELAFKEGVAIENIGGGGAPRRRKRPSSGNGSYRDKGKGRGRRKK
ncbi:MAG: DUF4290 domain-containing protein [Bacteroidetes bacterium]|nr:DUF4290 domain-containing protein [Bacteroidota bacterium]